MTKLFTKSLFTVALPLTMALQGCVPVESGNAADDQTDTTPDDDIECVDATTGAALECGPNEQCIVDAAGAAECECKDDHFGDACEYSREAVIEEFVGLPDPTEWNVDANSGTMYRLATAQEREKNGWLPGTFLIETASQPEGMRLKRQLVDLTIPMTPATARPLTMVFNGSDSGRSFIEADAAAQPAELVKSTVPVFNIYASKAYGDDGGTDLDGAIVVSVAVDGQFLALGSMERVGLNGTHVDRFRMTGPSSDWQIDPIPALGKAAPTELFALNWAPNTVPMESMEENSAQDLCGFPLPNQDDPLNPNANHPCGQGGGGGGGGGNPLPVNQCTNAGDDDGDGKVDFDGYGGGQGTFPVDEMCTHAESCKPINGYPYHDHAKESGLDYGLFGSVVWCTRNKDSWKADMYARALFNGNAFSADSLGNPGYNAFIDATNGSLMRWTTSKCWMMDTVQHAEDCKDNANACGPFAPGNQHVYPYGGLHSPRYNFSDYQYASYADLAHAVNLPAPLNKITSPLDLWQVVTWEGGNDQTWGGTATAADHPSIVNGAWSSLNIPIPYSSSPHEFGHTFGCGHCDTEYVEKVGGGGFGLTHGWSTMVTSAPNDNCAKGQNSGERSHRFGATCSLKIINAATNTNAFNRRSGPAGGPSFGW